MLWTPFGSLAICGDVVGNVHVVLKRRRSVFVRLYHRQDNGDDTLTLQTLLVLLLWFDNTVYKVASALQSSVVQQIPLGFVMRHGKPCVYYVPCESAHNRLGID